MRPSDGGKLQAPPGSAAAVGPWSDILIVEIKFDDVQRSKIDHRMAEMRQSRRFEHTRATSAGNGRRDGIRGGRRRRRWCAAGVLD
jgi:hypothetical protein